MESTAQFNYVHIASQTHLYNSQKHDKELLDPASFCKIRFVVISDTHNQHELLPALPDGDVLLHCGDFTNKGTIFEAISFNNFLGKVKHRYKYIIVIPGNHEFSPDGIYPFLTNATHFLLDSDTRLSFTISSSSSSSSSSTPSTITSSSTSSSSSTSASKKKCQVHLYGSRFKPFFSLPLMRDSMAKTNFDGVPSTVDILMTHQPPHGHPRGNKAMMEVIQKHKPHIHLFGHIHDNYGVYYDSTTSGEVEAKSDNVTYVCAVSLAGDKKAKQFNKPVVFDFAAKLL